MAALGKSEEEITAAFGPVVSADFEVWAENWEPVIVFYAAQTQWRSAGMGQLTGLDYTALESIMRMMAIKDPHAVFLAVQDLERGALEELNKSQ